MRLLAILAVWLSVACVLAFPNAQAQQLTIGGNLHGDGSITFNGSTMTGHLYGNGDLLLAGLTPFQITNPANGQCLIFSSSLGTWINSSSCGGGGSGTVTSVSVASANGLSGSVANPTTTPAITLIPTFTGITYSTGSALQAALASNFPTLNQSTTGNAATATALAAAPAQCTSGQYSTGVTAAGVANCAQVAASQLSNGVSGSGAVILATNASLTAPNLDTPVALTLTNATGLPLSGVANQAADTIPCNPTSSSAGLIACNPLQLANLMSATVTVDVATTANITLSGSQSIDGVVIGAGQTVLVKNQITSSQNGIYISASGAWTRAINFPTGYVIAANCDLMIIPRSGSTNIGHPFSLIISNTPLTIGTDNMAFATSFPIASSTLFGYTKTTASGASFPAASMTQTPSAAAGHAIDCASFTDVAGSVGDAGDANAVVGPCVVSDGNSHFVSQTTTPSISGAGCSIDGSSFDSSGQITATGADTCTITFSAAYKVAAPHCVVSSVGATTVAPFINALPTTTSFVIKTTLAGTASYVCL